MKIAILCSTSLDTFQQKVLQPIVNDTTIEVVGVLVDCRPRPSFKKRFLKNLKRGRGGYMIVMLFKSLFEKKRPTVSAKGFFEREKTTYIETRQPYSDEVLQRIKSLQPEVMVMIGGFGIVKEPLLSLTPKGILSYHHGNMRKYRGQPMGFWELFNEEKEMGVTVQRLAAGIDKGTPIVEMTLPIEKQDDVKRLRERALDSSVHMMYEALLRVNDPGFCPESIGQYGPIYTLPNLRQFLQLHIRLLLRK